MQIIWRDASLSVNRDYYQRLKDLYARHCPGQPDLFLVRVFCMLQRYESLGCVGLQVRFQPDLFPEL